MDSKKLLGIPVSATESAPPMLVSTGIRAPLTLDDSDSEYGKKDSGFSSYGSDSGLDSDGFLSGEEGFETASEKAFMTETNDEIHKETRFLKKYVVSRPIVKVPDEKTSGVSGSGGDFDDSRPLLHYPDEEIVEGNDVVEDYSESRPFIADKYEKDEGIFMEEDEKTGGAELPVVDMGIGLLEKQGMPIAKLSGDSDDDSLRNESVEDEPFLGVARVSSSGVLERLVSVPKVRVLEVGEGDDNASVSDSRSEAEVVEDSIVVGGDIEEEKQKVHELIAADVIEDKDLDILEEARGAELNEEIQGFDRNDDSVELGDEEKSPDPTNFLGSNGVEEVEQVLPCKVIEAEIIELKAEDNFGAASRDGDDYINKNVDGNITFVHGQSNDTEKLVSEIEQKFDQQFEPHCHEDGNNIESMDGATKENSVQMMNYLKLSETQVVQEQECFMHDHSADVTQRLVMDDVLYYSESCIRQAVLQSANLEPKGTCALEDDPDLVGKDDLAAHDVTENMDFEGSDEVDMADILEQFPAPSPLSHGESSHCDLLAVDAQVGTDLCDEQDAHNNSEGEEIVDSFSLAALLRAATGVESDNSSVMFSSGDGTRMFPLEQPLALDSSFLGLRPTPQLSPTLLTPGDMDDGEPEEILSQEEKEKLDRLQEIRVKFLRLVHRLNRSPQDSVAEKVLYQLELAAGRPSAQAFNFDFAKQAAMQLEAEGKNNLMFSLNILVIGKSGVGKSATINSIFGEEIATTNAFEPATTSVKEIIGTLNGIQVRVLDTPGLRSSVKEQSFNRKVLSLIKKFTKKLPPDVVLYVDRIDTQSRDLSDLPLLKLVTSHLGSSIWYSTIVTLTHATSTPPEGPSGYPLSYDMFVSQRSHVVQQLISHSIGNWHTMKPGLIPVALVENHSTHEMNKTERTFLPSEESWKSQLLLLCYSMKILSELDSVVKTKEVADYRKLFGYNVSSPSLPYFMSSLLQSNAHPKLSTTEGSDNVDSDIELACSYDCDQESEDEYDQLPPFKPLTRSEIAKLNKEKRNAYFEEYDYRVKLFQKKQWNEEVRRFQDAKKKRKDTDEDQDPDMDSQAALAVPLPDLVLPPSFDGDNPAYRYRYLESSTWFLTRPVLDLHGWDHDCGYDGIAIEDNIAIAGCFPATISVQLTKDKEELNVHLNSCFAAKHGNKGSTMAGLDIETVGKQLAYILKAETKLRNFKVNRTATGLSVTFLDKNVIAGVKVEDEIALGKQLVLVGCAGIVKCENDAACGANLGIRLREKDYPVGQDQSTLGLSLTRWRGDVVWGLNLQSQFSVRQNSKMSVRAELNSKQFGQASVRISSSDQLVIATLGILPIVKTIWRSLFTQR